MNFEKIKTLKLVIFALLCCPTVTVQSKQLLHIGTPKGSGAKIRGSATKIEASGVKIGTTKARIGGFGANIRASGAKNGNCKVNIRG